MFRPSRRAVVIAASFALGLSSIAPAALASRPGDGTDNGEESASLLDLSGLLGNLPVLGPTLSGLGVGSPSGQSLPTVEGIGLPTLEGLGLPGLDGLGLPLGSPLGILDILSTSAPGTPAPGLNILVDLGVTGAVNLL